MSAITATHSITQADRFMWQNMPFSEIEPDRAESEPSSNQNEQIDLLSRQIVEIETDHVTQTLKQNQSAFKVAKAANRLRIFSELQAEEIINKNRQIAGLETGIANILAEGVNLREQIHQQVDQNDNQLARNNILERRLRRNEERTAELEIKLATARESLIDRVKLVNLIKEDQALNDAQTQKVLLTASLSCCVTSFMAIFFPICIAVPLGGTSILLSIKSNWNQVEERLKIVGIEIDEIEARIKAES